MVGTVFFYEFCLEDRVPDHSSFSVNRHGRFRESDILRKVFEEVVCVLPYARLWSRPSESRIPHVIQLEARP